MEKTLLEHHYSLRIESLRDDPAVNYAQRIVAVEMLARERGWRFLCDEELIAIRVMQNTGGVYNA
jgi:hypothetical protein